ncbi:phosphotransferase family protein [Microlunatus soli]|uniref:phosphotransferase family protein n=1 Tax=Microlunatus soli TaxID=630515 RepID=UPI0012FA9502|nr:phosphotransferase [Microlunatus soli]
MDRPSTLAAALRRMAPGARLVDVRELPGGMSAQITALDVDFPDGSRTVVVRQYGPKNIAADPRPASTETTLLGSLRAAGIPVPAPLYADDGTDLLGGPFCVVEFISADGPPADWSDAVAEQVVDVLTRLHRLPVTTVGTLLAPYADRIDRWLAQPPEQPDEAMRESRIRTVLAENWPRRRELPSRILHGDFWPGNTMWADGRLRSVIDWEDAAIGDPRSDLANLRLELTWAYGPDAAEDATTRYLDSVADLGAGEPATDDLALWDLAAASRPVGRLAEWGLDPATWEEFLRRYQDFVDRALRQLEPR